MIYTMKKQAGVADPSLIRNPDLETARTARMGSMAFRAVVTTARSACLASMDGCVSPRLPSRSVRQAQQPLVSLHSIQSSSRTTRVLSNSLSPLPLASQVSSCALATELRSLGKHIRKRLRRATRPSTGFASQLSPCLLTLTSLPPRLPSLQQTTVGLLNSSFPCRASVSRSGLSAKVPPFTSLPPLHSPAKRAPTFKTTFWRNQLNAVNKLDNEAFSLPFGQKEEESANGGL